MTWRRVCSLERMHPHKVGMNLTAAQRAVYRHCVRLLAQRSDEAHRLVPTCHCDGEEGYEEPCALMHVSNNVQNSLTKQTQQRRTGAVTAHTRLYAACSLLSAIRRGQSIAWKMHRWSFCSTIVRIIESTAFVSVIFLKGLKRLEESLSFPPLKIHPIRQV